MAWLIASYLKTTLYSGFTKIEFEIKVNTWEKLANGLCCEKQLKTLKYNTTCLLRFNKKASLTDYSSNLLFR